MNGSRTNGSQKQSVFECIKASKIFRKLSRGFWKLSGRLWNLSGGVCLCLETFQWLPSGFQAPGGRRKETLSSDQDWTAQAEAGDRDWPLPELRDALRCPVGQGSYISFLETSRRP